MKLRSLRSDALEEIKNNLVFSFALLIDHMSSSILLLQLNYLHYMNQKHETTAINAAMLAKLLNLLKVYLHFDRST